MDINKKSRTELKAFFIKNAIPTESNFRDLVDATLNQKDDGLTKSTGDPLSLESAPVGEKKAINFYESFADAQPAWVLSLLPGVTSADPTAGKRGLGIRDGAGNPRLFIDGATGNVGLGTLTPTSKLEVMARPRTGTHATGLALYVTGDLNPAGGIEFRHSNGQQGIGFGYNTIYATGSNLDQELILAARGASSVNIPSGLRIDGNRPSHLEVDGSFYRYAGQAYITVDDTLYLRGMNQSAASFHFDTTNGGRLGIGMSGPQNKLDLAGAPRIGVHPTGQVLYVSGDLTPAGGIEFRHSNGTQGIGFGFNTIYATGTDANQDLNLVARGASSVIIPSGIRIDGNRPSHLEADGSFYRYGGEAYLAIDNFLYVRGVNQATPSFHFDTTNLGRFGVGMVNPKNKLDLAGAPRTGTHPEGMAVYASGDAARGIEFRQSDASKGTGFNASTIYSTGLNQDLNLTPNGTGKVNIPNRLDIQAVVRSGTHPTGLALYVSANSDAAGNGVEFRHTNGTQGIGFGFNTIYATGTDANQDLFLAARGASSVNILSGVRIDGNRATHLEADGSFYRYAGHAYVTVDDNFYLRGVNATSPVFHFDVSNGGRFGVGLTGPQNKVDIQQAGRWATHATGLALYVTADSAWNGGLAEFRHANGTQGVGIGYAAIYATGSNADQDLSILAKGTGRVNISEEDWRSASLVNGWVYYAAGWNPPGYFKDSSGIVHLRGLIRSGNAAVATVIFTLPAGYVPQYQILLLTIAAENVAARVDIRTNGEVVTGQGVNNTWLSLDGLSFRAHPIVARM